MGSINWTGSRWQLHERGFKVPQEVACSVTDLQLQRFGGVSNLRGEGHSGHQEESWCTQQIRRTPTEHEKESEPRSGQWRWYQRQQQLLRQWKTWTLQHRLSYVPAAWSCKTVPVVLNSFSHSPLSFSHRNSRCCFPQVSDPCSLPCSSSSNRTVVELMDKRRLMDRCSPWPGIVLELGLVTSW